MENSENKHRKFLQNFHPTCKIFQNFKEFHETLQNMLKNFERTSKNFTTQIQLVISNFYNILPNSSKRNCIEFFWAFSQSIRPRKTFTSYYRAVAIFWGLYISRTVDWYFFPFDNWNHFSRQYFNEIMKIRLKIPWKATFLQNNRKLSEMKVSGTHNKTSPWNE